VTAFHCRLAHWWHRVSGAAVLAILVALAAPAAAQTFSESFTGLGANSKDPIQIDARELEVRDKEHVAIFKGDVNVRQKNALLKAQHLKVFYTGGAGAAGQDISRIEAGGKVYVSSGDQVATGDKAVFDMKAEMLTVTGNVVLSKGPNVIQGEKLEIDLKTGQATFRSPSRIRMLIQPKSLGN